MTRELQTHLPYIYLSAGVSANYSKIILVFAAESGSKFNGVLCGSKTNMAGSVQVFIEQGEEAAREWLRTTGFQNMDRIEQKFWEKLLSLTSKV